MDADGFGSNAPEAHKATEATNADGRGWERPGNHKDTKARRAQRGEGVGCADGFAPGTGLPQRRAFAFGAYPPYRTATAWAGGKSPEATKAPAPHIG